MKKLIALLLLLSATVCSAADPTALLFSWTRQAEFVTVRVVTAYVYVKDADGCTLKFADDFEVLQTVEVNGNQAQMATLTHATDEGAKDWMCYDIVLHDPNTQEDIHVTGASGMYPAVCLGEFEGDNFEFPCENQGRNGVQYKIDTMDGFIVEDNGDGTIDLQTPFYYLSPIEQENLEVRMDYWSHDFNIWVEHPNAPDLHTSVAAQEFHDNTEGERLQWIWRNVQKAGVDPPNSLPIIRLKMRDAVTGRVFAISDAFYVYE